MFDPSPAFLRYVERAREGRTGLGQLLAGVVLIVALWATATVTALLIGILVIGVASALQDPATVIADFLASPGGVAAALASFGGLAAGVFLAVRLVARRPFGGVAGATGRLSWPDFYRGLAAALIVSGAAEAATFFVDPSLKRSAIGLGEWLLWLAPGIFLLFIQVSAEELAFRGYLLQSLAARFRSPLVWALLPLLLFTLLHWDANSSPPMLAAMLSSIAAFAAVATLLVVKTGNLAASIGAHLGLNMFGILFVSHMSWLSGLALFESRPLDAGEWSGLDALLVGLSGIASFVLMVPLLLHPRSPLKVGEA